MVGSRLLWGRDSRGATRNESLFIILLVAVLLLIFISIVDPGDFLSDDGSVPSYRRTNAFYTYRVLEKVRVGVMAYGGLHGSLPGDSPGGHNATGAPIGNNDGRIDRDTGENIKFFKDLVDTGTFVQPVVRIQGRTLDVYWTRLEAGGELVGQGNFLHLSRYHPMEALALDQYKDDGRPDSGNVLYTLSEDGEYVSLYVKLDALE